MMKSVASPPNPMLAMRTTPLIRRSTSPLSVTHRLRPITQAAANQDAGSPPGDADKIVEAMARVRDALTAAELNAQNVQDLPSARLPSALQLFWNNQIKPLVYTIAVIAYVRIIHMLSLPATIIGSFILGADVAIIGYRKSSLSASGAIAAAIVGLCTCLSSFRNTFVLLAFFFTSSALTKIGDDEKAKIDEEHKAGGMRDWVQVFCNAFIPTVVTIALGTLTNRVDLPFDSVAQKTATALSGAFLGYYACCCGDTWASELGQLSEEEPRLITTFRPVRKGTNGGVTVVGLMSSMAGGLLMGAVFYAMSVLSPGANIQTAIQQWKIIPLGVAAGVAGSLIDSILGATIQFTGYNRMSGKITSRIGPDVTAIAGYPLISNSTVNLVSATLTAVATAYAALYVF